MIEWRGMRIRRSLDPSPSKDNLSRDHSLGCRYLIDNTPRSESPRTTCLQLRCVDSGGHVPLIQKGSYSTASDIENLDTDATSPCGSYLNRSGRVPRVGDRDTANYNGISPAMSAENRLGPLGALNPLASLQSPGSSSTRVPTISGYSVNLRVLSPSLPKQRDPNDVLAPPHNGLRPASTNLGFPPLTRAGSLPSLYLPGGRTPTVPHIIGSGVRQWAPEERHRWLEVDILTPFDLSVYATANELVGVHGKATTLRDGLYCCATVSLFLSV